MKARKLTSSIATALAGFALSGTDAHAHELEKVTTVFQHAIPNVAGKSLVATPSCNRPALDALL